MAQIMLLYLYVDKFMRPIFINLRVCILGLTAIIAAIVMSFGCMSHGSNGAYQPLQKPWGWGSTTDRRAFDASIGDIGVHSIGINFDNPMNTSSFELIVSNEDGSEIQGIQQVWSYDKKVLHVRGPFPFCSKIDITILAGAKDAVSISLEEDMTLTATMIDNPLDWDGTDSCTADVPISPVFTDAADGVVLAGDLISRSRIFEEVHKEDLDISDVFYFDYSDNFDYADRMIMTPAGIAKLFWNQNLQVKNYTLYIWDTYDPVSDAATSSILYNIPMNASWNLKGPFDAGDLDGDGESELIVSEEIAGTESVTQQVYILKGPIAHGFDLPLMDDDIGGSGWQVGSTGEGFSPFVTVGDVTGDGMDDLAAIHYKISDWNQMYDYEVVILHGNEKIDNIFGVFKADKITGYPDRAIMDIDSGDFNGDGNRDLAVVEMQRSYQNGTYRYGTPHVNLFFGGGNFDGRSMITPNVELLWDTTEATASVRTLGDVNGDGRDDIGIFVTEKNSSNTITSSKIYLFMGHDMWLAGYYMTSKIINNANAIFDVKGNGETSFETIGDIDNDGYYDIMILSDDGSDLTASFFFGTNAFSGTGWRLKLDDANSTLVFRND